MNTKTAHEAWFVLADAHKARLLRCSTTRQGRLHIQQHDAVEQKWEGHEHGRPSPLAAKTGHSYASAHHDVEEDHHRFAHQLIQWLENVVRDHQIDHLTIFVPPRMLGLLRDLHTEQLSRVLELREENLVNLPDDALQEHPAVLRLIAAAPVD